MHESEGLSDSKTLHPMILNAIRQCKFICKAQFNNKVVQSALLNTSNALRQDIKAIGNKMKLK